MFGPKRSYRLGASLLAAIVTLADDSATISAQESSSAPAEVATLELHDIRASNLEGVADLITSIVPAERVALIAASRQLAVFAVPSVQDAVAKRITDHEKSALLAEAIDFVPCDPHMVWDRVEQARRMQLENCENRLSKRLNYKLDASMRRLLVWGSESDIKFVQSVIGTMVQAEAADQETHQVAGSERVDRPDSKSHSLGDSDARPKPGVFPPADDRGTAMPQLQRVSGLPFSETKFLSVPRGPVKIVHIEGLDLLLIRGRLGVPTEVEPNRPAQD